VVARGRAADRAARLRVSLQDLSLAGLHRDALDAVDEAAGGLTPTHYSLVGYYTRTADIAETMAPAIAARLKAEGADAALVVPV